MHSASIERCLRSSSTRAACCTMLALASHSAVAVEHSADSGSVKLRPEAWWTGPLLASSPSTLPRGHMLIEPYLFRSAVNHRFMPDGRRERSAASERTGTRTYILYGLTDRLTIGVIPQVGLSAAADLHQSTGVKLGDVMLHTRYRLTTFQEGRRRPVITLGISETLPTGRYDRLGESASDGSSAGVYATTLSFYAQSVFWPFGGRPLRARVELGESVATQGSVADVSVYGTPSGFRGHVHPGAAFLADFALEYSLSRHWVGAMDLTYSENGNTRLAGTVRTHTPAGEVHALQIFNSGSSAATAVAPAMEYNWSASFGVIAGAILTVRGRNVGDGVVPVIAFNWIR